MNDLEDVAELIQMSRVVRRVVDSLDVCRQCNKVSECEPVMQQEGEVIWLCATCQGRPRNGRPNRPPKQSWWAALCSRLKGMAAQETPIELGIERNC